MLVISGAYYYDEDLDYILVPHYTGEFFVVDCDRFMTVREMLLIYDKRIVKEFVDDFHVEYKGKKYYRAEWGPFNIDNWELLSDLSDLKFTEKEFDFD